MNTDELNKFHSLIKRLDMLLDDRHPGLFTWRAMANELMNQLAVYVEMYKQG